MKITKQGVSLIVLVITIIVIIILAGSVILSLSKTNIFNQAEDAVKKSNLNEVQNIATLAWSEAYIDNMDVKDQKTRENNIKTAVNEALTQAGVKLSNYYITIKEKGVTVREKFPSSWKASVREVTEDGVPIPKGFVKSHYENEGTKDDGLVIYALTPTEISQGKTKITDDYKTALETRNQFVWVPVESDKFKELFVRSNNGWKDSDGSDKYALSSTLGTDYWELVLDINNMPADNTKNITSYVSAATLKEATAMYASVKKYGGFYIARYEVGTKTVTNDTSKGYIATRVSIKTETNSNLSVTMGKYPYNFVRWGSSMKAETTDDGAVSLARAFYPSTDTTYGVVSTLTYGVQWDRTLAWWKEQNSNINLTYSTSYGVYNDTIITSSDLNEGAEYSVYADSKFGEWDDITAKKSNGKWLLTTGAYKKSKVYNIYDMAGSLWEWTMEGEASGKRVAHGGRFDAGGQNYPVILRNSNAPNSSLHNYGFRPSLYIK